MLVAVETGGGSEGAGSEVGGSDWVRGCGLGEEDDSRAGGGEATSLETVPSLLAPADLETGSTSSFSRPPTFPLSPSLAGGAMPTALLARRWLQLQSYVPANTLHLVPTFLESAREGCADLSCIWREFGGNWYSI